jgi:hypothetical protein
MEKSVERLAGDTEVLGENLPQCRCVHHKTHMLPGREPGVPWWEASLSYNTASLASLHIFSYSHFHLVLILHHIFLMFLIFLLFKYLTLTVVCSGPAKDVEAAECARQHADVIGHLDWADLPSIYRVQFDSSHLCHSSILYEKFVGMNM